MKMKFIILTSTALMLTAVYAEAAPQPAKAMVPIEGAVATVIKPPVTEGPYLYIKWDGCAIISHLGQVTCYSYDEMVDFTPQESLPVMTGTIYFKAANGDVLIATMDGFVTSPPDQPVTFEGVLTFTGGSGRFSTATGTAAYAGGADMQTMTGWFTIDGEIQYKKK